MRKKLHNVEYQDYVQLGYEVLKVRNDPAFEIFKIFTNLTNRSSEGAFASK